MFNKRGISAIVATVLIILITVAAVTIVWAAIIPMIKTNLELGTACLEADVLIDGGSGYTCYDAEKKIVAVQVKKGVNEVNISEVEFLLDSEGTSRKITTSFGLGSNSGKTFYLIVDEDAERVSIAPVIKIGNKERACDISSNVKLSKCSLREEGVGSFLNEQGIVGFWRFEDNADDVTGNNDGVVNGDPVFVDGRNNIGKALSFDGVDDYVDISSLDNGNFPQEEATISFWIYGDLSNQSLKPIFDNYASRNHIFMRTYSQAYPTSNLQIRAQSSIDYLAGTNLFVPENQWTYIAVSYHIESGAFKIYMNNEIKYNGTISDSTWRPNEQDVRFGQNFNGIIDEVMIFNRALSGEEVEELYESQK